MEEMKIQSAQTAQMYEGLPYPHEFALTSSGIRSCYPKFVTLSSIAGLLKLLKPRAHSNQKPPKMEVGFPLYGICI